MELKTAKLQKHFYTYCAMFYANNRTIGYKDWVSELKDKVIQALEKSNTPKLDMPLHSYHYLMGIFNPDGYEDNGKLMVPAKEVIDYVDRLSAHPELQALWKQYEPDFDTRLKDFEDRFSDIENLFNNHFDFEPDIKAFYLTRNWDTSGKCIKTKDSYYVLVGWKKEGINLNQILHELIHSYLDKCTLTIPEDVTEYLKRMPEEVLGSYAEPSFFIEESIIRALVVYLSHAEENIQNYSLVGTDLDMLLPAKYLEILEKDKPTKLTIEYLNKLKF